LIRAGRRPIGPRCRGRSARPDRWPSALLCLGKSLIISRVDIRERRLYSDPQFRRPAPACDTPCVLLTATACCQSQGGNGESRHRSIGPRPSTQRDLWFFGPLQVDSHSDGTGAGTVAPEDVRQPGSNPVVPTFFRNEPFGENVEGLFHCRNQSCNSTRLFNSQGAIE
jgi:hypothetical protein